jgi:hypothetical protein
MQTAPFHCLTAILCSLVLDEKDIAEERSGGGKATMTATTTNIMAYDDVDDIINQANTGLTPVMAGHSINGGETQTCSSYQRASSSGKRKASSSGKRKASSSGKRKAPVSYGEEHGEDHHRHPSSREQRRDQEECHPPRRRRMAEK